MSYLIDKFKGQYRILAPIDQRTNDYPKKLNGVTYEDIDLYIPCKMGGQITHYGRNILQAYIPSTIRGKNIINAINEISNDLIFNIIYTDKEVIFNFKYADSDKIIPSLQPKTFGAGISPFSPKNRHKSDYKIPDEDLLAYKEIMANTPRELVLTVGHISKNFIKTLVTKKHPIEDIKADMVAKGMKANQYIHYIGKWNDYIKYLRKNLKDKEGELANGDN